MKKNVIQELVGKAFRSVRTNTLQPTYSPEKEVSFMSIMTDGPAKLATQLADGRRTTWACRDMELPELIESYPHVGQFGTRGCTTLSEHGASMSDGLRSKIRVGRNGNKLGVFAEGDTDVFGNLEVQFDSLLHGFLTVEGATELMKTLVVHGEATFEALSKFLDKVECHDEVTFLDKTHIDSYNLRINKVGAKDFVKQIVSTEMIGQSAAGPVQLTVTNVTPDEPPAKE